MFSKYAKAFTAAVLAAALGELNLIVVTAGPWQKWGMALVAVLTALGVRQVTNVTRPAARNSDSRE